MDYKILIEEDFLPKDTCKRMANSLSRSNLWENNGDGIWNNRSINLGSMTYEDLEMMLTLRSTVKEKITKFYDLTESLYSDIFQFVRWREGNNLEPPHADAENLDGSDHPFFYRNYASIIYLNDDYEGGEIYFPTLNIRPNIKPGTLVSFPGTLEYLHGVSTVTRGTRYTIAGFFTFDKNYHDGRRI